MINTLVLGVLLGIMAIQHIRWRYTGELIIALLPTLLVGSVGASSRCVHHPGCACLCVHLHACTRVRACVCALDCKVWAKL